MRITNKLAIRGRITLMIAIPIAALLLLAGIGRWSLKQQTGSMKQIVEEQLMDLIDK
jgi:hypothetical protein